MKIILKVDGMQCEHCKANIEKALLSIDGVKKVDVDLKNKTVALILFQNIEDSVLKSAVSNAGYTVLNIQK